MPLRHDIRRGALFMLVATALFTAMGALVKLAAAEGLHFLQLMFFRSVLAVPVVLLIVSRAPGGPVLRTRRFGQHLGRALTGTTAMAGSFYALTVLPLAEQTALTYTTPLFVTVLAIPFLGERVGIHRAGAVVAGFLGILVIALGEGAFGGAAPLAVWGVAAAVGHGLFSAATTLLVRSLSATETSGTIVLWQSLLMTAITGVAMPFVWVDPTGHEWLLLVLIGLVGGVAQVLLTEAYASAQVSALGAFSYTSILWSVILGFLLFGDRPTAWTLAGAALIVAAGLHIMHREMVRKVSR